MLCAAVLRGGGRARAPRLPVESTTSASSGGGRRAAHAAHALSDMPTPRGLPVVGTSLALLWAGSAPRLHEYVDMRHRQLGPVFRDRIGPVSAVFVADPVEMRRTFGLEGKHPMHVLPEPWILYNQLYGCKRGLFFMDGEDWLHMRRVLNRLMLKPDQADVFAAPCRYIADSLVCKWKSSNAGVVENLEEQLYKWSLDTMIAVMAGSNYKMHCNKWNAIVQHLPANIHKIFLESGRMSLISAKYARACHLPVWKRFVNTVDISLSTARTLVLEMIASCSSSSDGLLSEMLNTGVSEEDIIKVVADFIIAAGDTTALSLQWTLYLLAKNLEVQENIANEICEETNVMQSALLKGVVREALRLYPVAPFLTRIMPESCVIGGYELPPFELVLLSLYTSGRDTVNFPEPEKFWPERWLRNTSNGSYKAVTNPHASMPFAMGARSCIGKKLAETQMIMTVASILKEFKIELLNVGDIEMVLRLVAVPSKPIQIRLTPRHK